MLNKHLLFEKIILTGYKIVMILQHFLLNQSHTNTPPAAFGSCPVNVSLWSRGPGGGRPWGGKGMGGSTWFWALGQELSKYHLTGASGVGTVPFHRWGNRPSRVKPIAQVLSSLCARLASGVVFPSMWFQMSHIPFSFPPLLLMITLNLCPFLFSD